MDKKKNTTDEIVELARSKGILQIRDVREAGFHPEHVRRLCQSGRLKRIDRNAYVLADAEMSADISLASVSKRIPNGVMCLLTALRYHDIGTQLPHAVWVAIDRNTPWPRPAIENPTTQIFRFSGQSFTAGIEVYNIDGVPVRIYDPGKTVVDCFKYRNKIGLDVALEALKDVLRNRRCTVGQIFEYARIRRLSKVIYPYMEAML